MAVVLVINDDADMLATYEALLLAMGHQPVTKMALDAGPATVRSTRADALLVDLQRADEHEYGLRVIEQVRADPAVSELPIILCTGAADSVRPLSGRLQALRVPVVLKPFAVAELEAALRAALGPAEDGT